MAAEYVLPESEANEFKMLFIIEKNKEAKILSSSNITKNWKGNEDFFFPM